MSQKVDMKDATLALHEAKFDLLSLQPFYAILLQKHSLRWNADVGTAGVGVTSKGVPVLYVAPEFFLSLSKFERVGLLMHEMLHVVMRHLSRGKDLNPKVANIAMDIAINQFIPETLLPRGALLPQQFIFRTGEAFEYYYVALLNSSQKDNKETLDNHNFTGDEEDGASEAVTQASMDTAISEAIKTCRDSFAGRVPKEVEKIFHDYLAEKVKTNWKSILKGYVGRSLSSEKESTRSRPNRRQGFMATGMKHVDSPKVLVGIDHSGSVNDTMVKIFEDELRGVLSALTDRTEVAYFDTKIQATEKLRDARGRSPTRYASGGTDFNAIAEYAKQQKPDVLIVFTDAEASAPKVLLRCPVIWCIVGNSSDSHLNGRKIRLRWEQGSLK